MILDVDSVSHKGIFKKILVFQLEEPAGPVTAGDEGQGQLRGRGPRGGVGSYIPALNLRLREVERAYPGLYARLSDWSAEGWDYLAQRIEEGARSGAFRAVDKAALELLLAGFHRELAARGFRAAPGLPLEATLEGLADILLGGLLPRGSGG
jgi:hypothetical protein